jgi:hypothetical protein
MLRRAEFIIFSDTMSVAEMTSGMGYPPDFSLAKGAVPEGALARIPAKWSSWELHEEAGSLADAVTALFRRLHPDRDKLRQLRDRGCSASLSVTQWMEPETNLGFVIEAEDVQLLADAGAFIDVDQYADEGQGPS